MNKSFQTAYHFNRMKQKCSAIKKQNRVENPAERSRSFYIENIALLG